MDGIQLVSDLRTLQRAASQLQNRLRQESTLKSVLFPFSLSKVDVVRVPAGLWTEVEDVFQPLCSSSICLSCLLLGVLFGHEIPSGGR